MHSDKTGAVLVGGRGGVVVVTVGRMFVVVGANVVRDTDTDTVVVVVVISVLITGTVTVNSTVSDIVPVTVTVAVVNVTFAVGTSVTVFVERRVVKISFVDVRVLLANWVLVSVSVSVTVLPLVSVTVMNCVVVSIMVPRSGGPGKSGVPVGGTVVAVEIIPLVVVLVLLGFCPPFPGRVAVTVLVMGFRHLSVGKVTVRVSVLGFGLDKVTVDSHVVVFNAEGQLTAAGRDGEGVPENMHTLVFVLVMVQVSVLVTTSLWQW